MGLVEPFDRSSVIMIMERNQEKQTIEAKLARCRELAQEFPDGATAQMIRDMEDELREQLRAVDRQ